MINGPKEPGWFGPQGGGCASRPRYLLGRGGRTAGCTAQALSGVVQDRVSPLGAELCYQLQLCLFVDWVVSNFHNHAQCCHEML